MTTGLEGCVALVTGAGSGIGRAVCVRLAEEGAEVVVTSRTPANVAATAREVERVAGHAPLALVLDIVDRHAAAGVVSKVVDRHGKIDVLSNNAGIDLPHAPTVVETTDDEWDRVLAVNMTGIFALCRAAIPALGDGGSIVNMASMNSLVAYENTAPYSASKGALLQFTRALALELAPRRIRVNCVCPGIIDTPLTDSFLELAADPDALRAEYEAVAPLGRLGTAREVANCVAFLAGDESTFVTGSALVVDGGTTAR
jgi:NAD(P)-dependent dehydrogenase (short-subunit alcohol dehydrogenase family)